MNANTDAPKKKILLVSGKTYSLVNFRGPLVKALINAGLEVHAAAPGLLNDTKTCQQLETWGAKTHNFTMVRNGLNPFKDVVTLYQLYRLMRKVRPEIMLAYTIKPVIYGVLAAWLASVPKRYALITGLGYAFAEQARGKRAIVYYVVSKLYKYSLNKAEMVFFQNPDDEFMFRSLEILNQDVPSKVLNGSGVDMEHYALATLPEAPLRFLIIARLLGDKGIRQYAEAAKRIKQLYPEVIFQLAGVTDSNPDSITQKELNTWIEEGAIEYLGWLDDVRPAIADCSVYVLPSYYREGTPRSILEAMSMGRAIITTDAPGCRETVIDGENGYLVPVRDVDALVEVMTKFIDSYSSVQKMGACSYAIAKKKYDVHKVNTVMLESMEVMGLAGSINKNENSLIQDEVTSI